jgi:hypothetical protein
MRARLAVVVVATGLISGCATTGLYEWAGYEQALYTSYKDPTQVESLRTKLEIHIAEMEQTRKKVAPGLYAELGTLHLQSGDIQKARKFYVQEREAWPESKVLMTALIQSLDRRQQRSLPGAPK